MSVAASVSEIRTYDKLYIGGKWVQPAGTGLLDVVNSTTEQVMGRVPEGTAADAEMAIEAARGSFEAWSALPVSERVNYLKAICVELKARQEEIASIIVDEVGMPMSLALNVQAGLPIAVISSYLQIASEFPFEEQVGSSVVVREPVGVVACITPWNYPLHQVVAKVAPALAAGCTVVLKPSEVAPLTAFVLAEIIEKCGLPAGVFNLVSGVGAVVGEVLASHPGVDMVSFTGSTRAGKRVSELAAKTVKRVALELGGKSASVILPDADLKKAVSSTVANCYFNSGQTCSAHTRMLVPREKQEEAIAIAKATAEKFQPGDPRDAATRLGPLISEVQRERVRSYIRKGIEEGATLVTGGEEQPQQTPHGYFVKPTVFANVDTRMTIAQEEIFGPVLSIIPYDSEDEAVEIANDSVYGLGGGVWAGDVDHAKKVARRIRTGQVEINGGKFNPVAPFGGYKQSGNGREFGRFGLEEFLEVKSMQF